MVVLTECSEAEEGEEVNGGWATEGICGDDFKWVVAWREASENCLLRDVVLGDGRLRMGVVVVGGAVLIRRFGESGLPLYMFTRRVCMAAISSGVKPADASCVDQEGGRPMNLKKSGALEKSNTEHKTYASST